jgi:glycosyltransferase involved in cell wall biosynthesis
MDWIVFGDDWGVHPSTPQHLVLNLPAEDRVIWVDSIGMRQPRLGGRDLHRIVNKLRGFVLPANRTSAGPLYRPRVSGFARLQPKIIPFHLSGLARRANCAVLARALTRLVQELDLKQPTLLSLNPVVAEYFEAIPAHRVGYLRLDRYEQLPGVDPELIHRTEGKMVAKADAIFCTARKLHPGTPWQGKTHYLSQGVDTEHFAQVDLTPPSSRVLGFFGVLNRWVDFELIIRVAALAPHWRLELVGPATFVPASLRAVSNVAVLPAVPFSELPRTMARWSAAWIPFEVSELTVAVNPLKAREYLAAGLAFHTTPLPEVAPLVSETDGLVSVRADEIVDWLENVVQRDSPERRLARRRSVAQDSWVQRSAELRSVMGSIGPAGREAVGSEA